MSLNDREKNVAKRTETDDLCSGGFFKGRRAVAYFYGTLLEFNLLNYRMAPNVV
jgi:hypothetical protein